MSIIIQFVIGMVFGLGLVVSGMSNPAKVLNFLDLAAIRTGSWDPSLAFVMVGAVVTAFIGFRLVLKRPRPVFAETFHLPARSGIDPRVIIGPAIFGIGWGLAGFCPGPAFVALGYGSSQIDPVHDRDDRRNDDRPRACGAAAAACCAILRVRKHPIAAICPVMLVVASPAPVTSTRPGARDLIKRREKNCEDNHACWHRNSLQRATRSRSNFENTSHDATRPRPMPVAGRHCCSVLMWRHWR